ncbi:ferrous iron transport protein B [Oscillospiraceae bacterium HV4-5-C5C]|nr:ferrous iron transport protein B [Oscillospiraceae bacterium HV4-5-C5C]
MPKLSSLTVSSERTANLKVKPGQSQALSDGGLFVRRRQPSDYVIALAGNPNVGKSTVFNHLTGLHQHTGNWPGKTVANAQGYCQADGQGYIFVDLPGSYSLAARSAEEALARDFICFGHPDAAVVVCDAGCLQRNLNLVLQIMEVIPHTLVCVNLLDEAAKKKLKVDLALLQQRLGVPVLGMAARQGQGLEQLLPQLNRLLKQQGPTAAMVPLRVAYPAAAEAAIAKLQPIAARYLTEPGMARFICARLLDGDSSFSQALEEQFNLSPASAPELFDLLASLKADISREPGGWEAFQDSMAAAFVRQAARLCQGVTQQSDHRALARDRRLDWWFTSKWTGFPIMLLLLLLLFWLTISGANVPSQLLSQGFGWLELRLAAGLSRLGVSAWLIDLLIHGVYNVMTWVISVMLPPMAIFFPLFTLLEDYGYLPRIAFNLDRSFQKARACGKQALTMCMGFGCNAAGVTGCRIIDSPRERLIAILTNNFVPCNGRFPTLIALITLFLIGSASGWQGSLLGALLLVAVIVLGVMLTLLASRLLSGTVLKGVPSSFTLELPPYRRPQFGRVIGRSMIDRTLKVLGRAVVVAAPAGLLIWILANIRLGTGTLLQHMTAFLDPMGRALGMDGTILSGFILGFPANEIVMPIIVMTYLAQGHLTELSGSALAQLFVQNGWTWVTAVCTILFSLLHWPCATACLTVHKETQSWKWTLLSFALPTAFGLLVCFTVARLAAWLL